MRIENSHFIDNESGVLAASSPNSNITIRDSHFIANGSCRSGHCAAAIAVDHIARLSVLNCTISDTKGGDAISTLAAHTELIDNHIEDGVNGTAAYLVDLPAGGSLEMNNNVLERGPLPAASSVAVRVMEGVGTDAVKTLTFSGNTLKNDTHGSLTFVLNWTGTTARMQNNHLPQDTTPASSSGYLWFLTKSSIHRGLTAAKALARAVRHQM